MSRFRSSEPHPAQRGVGVARLIRRARPGGVATVGQGDAVVEPSGSGAELVPVDLATVNATPSPFRRFAESIEGLPGDGCLRRTV